MSDFVSTLKDGNDLYYRLVIEKEHHNLKNTQIRKTQPREENVHD